MFTPEIIFKMAKSKVRLENITSHFANVLTFHTRDPVE